MCSPATWFSLFLQPEESRLQASMARACLSCIVDPAGSLTGRELRFVALSNGNQEVSGGGKGAREGTSFLASLAQLCPPTQDTVTLQAPDTDSIFSFSSGCLRLSSVLLWRFGARHEEEERDWHPHPSTCYPHATFPCVGLTMRSPCSRLCLSSSNSKFFLLLFPRVRLPTLIIFVALPGSFPSYPIT